MIQIFRRNGWILNPNDKVVNAILRRCEMNNGECPCQNSSVNKNCPCSDYIENDVCHCGLYIKKENTILSLDLSKLPKGILIEDFIKSWNLIQESPLIIRETNED